MSNRRLHLQSMKKETDTLLNFLTTKKLKIDRAISIGCGDGSDATNLSKILKIKEIHGIDEDKKLLAKAKQRGVITLNLGLDEIKKDFDLVIVYDSLYLYGDLNNLISEIKRISKKYILIVDNTVRKNSFHWVTGSRFFPLNTSGKSLLKEKEIFKSLEENGCSVIDSLTIPNGGVTCDRTVILSIS